MTADDLYQCIFTQVPKEDFSESLVIHCLFASMPTWAGNSVAFTASRQNLNRNIAKTA